MNITKTALAFLLIHFSHIAFSQDIKFSSGDYQNTLIELYTSEGCSSCPPADQWLSRFKDHPQLFSEIIPIAFHVDYWDYIGWQDEFAEPEYGERQSQYYRQGGINGKWTPQLIKNGKGNRDWRYQADTSGKKVGNLSVNVLDDKVYVDFKSQQKRQPLVAHIALLGFGFENTVTAGENEDRVLKHDFVVLNHVQKTSQGNRWSVKLPQSDKPAKRLALAVWITSKKSLKPIQVTADWL